MKRAARAIVVRGDKILVMKRNKYGLEYYCLVGGGVDMGETTEQAVVREVLEESSLQIKDYRLVFVEEASVPFGVQYIYLCKDPGGEIYLSEESVEAQINKGGNNLYQVEWLKKSELGNVEFRSQRLQMTILEALDKGFPRQPKILE